LVRKKKKEKRKTKHPSNEALLFYSWFETKMTKGVHLSPEAVIVLFSQHRYGSILQDI